MPPAVLAPQHSTSNLNPTPNRPPPPSLYTPLFKTGTYSPRYVQLWPMPSDAIPGVSIGGSDTSLENATTDTYTLDRVTVERHLYGNYPCCPDDSYW